MTTTRPSGWIPTFALLLPSDEMSPLDTVLGLARNGGQGTQRYSSTRGMHVQLAFDAARHSRKDNPRLASETLGATIDQGLEAVWVFLIHHADQSGIYPSSRLNAVETTDNDVELEVVVLILVLDLATVWRDLDTFHATFDEACSHFGFVRPDV